jgi:hypothetical protein
MDYRYMRNELTWLNRLGLYDITPDTDNLFNGMCVPTPQANYILNLSTLSFISSIYGIYRNHIFYALIPFSVGCTTILYWTHPVNCWKRYLDICVAICGLAIQLTYAINAQYSYLYYAVNAMAILCYPIGHYYHNRGHIWAGTLWHGGIHIFGNIANIILYSGKI